MSMQSFAATQGSAYYGNDTTLIFSGTVVLQET